MAKDPQAASKKFQLYIRSHDVELFNWAQAEARRRRMKVSQFVMLCIEQERKRK